MSYPKYFSYKSMLNLWPGNVPELWEIKKLKYSVKLINEKVDVEENAFIYTGLENIESWTGKRIETSEYSPEGIANIYQPNDVLFGKLRPYLAKVFLTSNSGCCTSEALVLRNNVDVNPSFLKYFLLSKQFIELVNSSSFGSKMPRASWEFISSLGFLLPSNIEQQTIAKFLDYKTEQIHELIDKKEQLLKLLEEKRIALITNAVTGKLSTSPPWRGLRGGSQLDKHNNVTMKPSGISWLGNIPSNWYVCQLKYVAKISYGIGGEIDKSITEGVRLLSLPNVSKEGDLLLDEEYYIELSDDEKESLLLKEGDLLFNWRNGSSDHLGKTVIINSSDEFTHVSFLLRIRFKKKFDSRYFKYLLHGFRMTRYFSSSKAGVNNTFNLSELSELRIIVPTKDDQINISDYLDIEIDKILKLRSTIINAIEKLKEYRASLITSAVTGKIDLRNWSLPSLSLPRRGTEGEVGRS